MHSQGTETEIRPWVWLTFIVTAGLSVANIYYNQPLLEQMRLELDAPRQMIGLVPTATQLGYACGMFLLVPLGDMFERKRLVLLSLAASTFACLAVAVSSNVSFLIGASFILGLSTITPQYVIPFAAHLAGEKQRMHVVGWVVSGLLLGILLARTLSGLVGAAWGWRAMFLCAACIQVALASWVAIIVPLSPAHYSGTYWQLQKSIGHLFCTEPILREACLAGAMIFGAFSTFWATLIYLLQEPQFGLGARAAGLFGLVGAAGALSAPYVGRMLQNRVPRTTAWKANVLAMLAFVLLYWSRSSLLGLVVGVLILDVAVQTAHVANQGRIFARFGHARSRVNTAYMCCYFSGAAVGSALATWAYSRIGWLGVCEVALAMLVGGGLVFLTSGVRQTPNAVAVTERITSSLQTSEEDPI